MPEYVAKRSSFVNTFLLKRSKKVNSRAGSKVADERLKNPAPQVTSSAAFDRSPTLALVVGAT
jgi:hypothetical protein